MSLLPRAATPLCSICILCLAVRCTLFGLLKKAACLNNATFKCWTYSAKGSFSYQYSSLFYVEICIKIIRRLDWWGGVGQKQPISLHTPAVASRMIDNFSPSNKQAEWKYNDAAISIQAR